MISTIRKNLRTLKTGVIDQRKASFRRLKELYREGGVSEVYRGIRDYYVYNVADEAYHSSRTDNEDRWEIIEPHLNTEYESMIDLGCADGFFLDKAAAYGLEVQGFEGNQNRVDRARELCLGRENVTVEQRYLSPDNIDDLPPSDVVLLLTVHHHWIRQYGWDEAAEMVRTIAAGTELLFYEPPGDKKIGRDGSETPLDPADSIDYYRDELAEMFGDKITILGVAMVEYNNSDRSDPFFVIDTSGYNG